MNTTTQQPYDFSESAHVPSGSAYELDRDRRRWAIRSAVRGIELAVQDIRIESTSQITSAPEPQPEQAPINPPIATNDGITPDEAGILSNIEAIHAQAEEDRRIAND